MAAAVGAAKADEGDEDVCSTAAVEIAAAAAAAAASTSTPCPLRRIGGVNSIDLSRCFSEEGVG